MPISRYSKAPYDISQLFLIYLAFNGDPDRTAIATGVEVDVIRKFAAEEHWDDKAAELCTLRGAEGNKALEVEINRKLCFTQAQRLRNLVDQVINFLTMKCVSEDGALDSSSLIGTLMQPVKGGGQVFSAKALLELVKAAEGAHMLAYRALGDTPAERVNEGDEEKNARQASMAVLHALRALDETGSGVAYARNAIAAAASDSGAPHPAV